MLAEKADTTMTFASKSQSWFDIHSLIHSSSATARHKQLQKLNE